MSDMTQLAKKENQRNYQSNPQYMQKRLCVNYSGVHYQITQKYNQQNKDKDDD